MTDLEASDTSNEDSSAETSLFIEMVKECVESAQILPILLIVVEGSTKIQTLHQALPDISLDVLLQQLEIMMKYTLLTQSKELADSYHITQLGIEFKDILIDIEKLKEKYH